MQLTHSKIYLFVVALAFVATSIALQPPFFNSNKQGNGEGMEEDISGRISWMQKMLGNPYTNEAPFGMRNKELAFAATLPLSKENLSKADYGIWVQRGPGNVGGRTRAIGIDKTNENILIAGASSGGMWRSMDRGISWQRMSADTDYIPATCIAQDPRPGKTNNWYVGTGELYGSALPGGYIYGYGIRKSSDGGVTWQRMTNTFSPNPVFDNSFDFVHRIVVNPAIDSLDVVFAATFDGIYRSNDGGKTWNRRRGGNTGGSSYWTDVAITKTGVIYAALSNGGHGGVWRSINNGLTWTNITPPFYTINTERIVMCMAPSDENQIYFTAYTPGSGKQCFNFNGTEEWNSLWKYTYKEGDGTGNGGTWEDRSVNIPFGFAGDFGQFITQRGYSIHIDVKPDNPDVVFLGGTNLYRSTDGFKTSTKTVQVGGYDKGTVRPDYQMYPNHHPDQHGVIFFPSHPNQALSVDDGGIQYTENCVEENLQWTSLNNGYVTTQFYTVAIDHTTTSSVLMGGLQDNGTQLTTDGDYTKPWTMPYSSDGSFCFVGAGATEYYVSIQEGRVYRIKLDAQNKLSQMARLDRKGLNRSKYQFINPFTVDRNEWKRIYIPNGNALWRNNDVSVIPMHPTIDSNAVTTGWEELTNARLPDSTDEITAITSSLSHPDVIYYGSMRGKLFRIKGASVGDPMVENITGINFPTGYINCIATHPTDTNKLYCVFSNYGILSVFYSDNGGTSWNAISGNLEQNINGSGNGPSCRWFTVVPLADSTLYFVGTSTGLFATSNINGMNTVWSRQGPNSIGLNVVTMMDYRSTDNMLAVSTYGAGAFTAIVSSKNRTSVTDKNKEISVKIYPNPATDFIHIELPNNMTLYSYDIYNLKGQLVSSKQHELSQTISIQELKRGIYILRLFIGDAVVTKKICIK